MTLTQDDTIPVRKDEELDLTRLATWLANKLPGAEDPEKLMIRQFGGGVANLTYLIKYSKVEYVLRRPPLGKLAKSSHDMSREHKVLSVLHKQFSKVPKSFLFCDDPAIIGAPFFVMERKKGLVIRKRFPDSYKSIGDAGFQISEALVDALAELHQVDYEAIGLQDLGRPEGFIKRQIEGWYKRWGAAKVEEYEKMSKVYEWLLTNIPTTTTYSLVHNDYKLDNVMLSPEDPSTIISIFDWDMCTLGDPLSDLGAMLTYWTEPDDPAYFQGISMMPNGDFGFMTREQLVERYEKKTGRKITNINFYHALGLFRLVVIIAQIYVRYVRKQTSDPRFKALGDVVPLVINAAYEVAFNN